MVGLSVVRFQFKSVACAVVCAILSQALEGTEAVAEQSPVLRIGASEVRKLTMEQAPRLKQAEYAEERSSAQAEAMRGAYDLIMSLAPTYEYTRAQNLAGFANRSDRTATVVAGLNQRLSTGSFLSAQIQTIQQESELNPFFSNLRPSRAALSVVSLQVRQSLWRNLFGEADRATLEVADAQTLIAELNKEEAVEGLLVESLTLYWNAVTAQVQLRENRQARDKFRELVLAVRKKAGFNLNAPGELPRLEAELDALEVRVLQSEQEAEASIENLRTQLKLSSEVEISLVDVDRLDSDKIQSASGGRTSTLAGAASVVGGAEPLRPGPQSFSLEKLRPVQIARLQMQAAEKSKKIADSNSRARVDLLLEARSTGVQQSTDIAFNQMTEGNFPTYIIGLQVEVPWDSSGFRGVRAEADANFKSAEVEYRLAQQQVRDRYAQAERAVRANSVSARATKEIVLNRQKALKELEASYRQGRTPLIELIRGYNEFFLAVQERARTVGALQVALANLEAVRDEMIPNVR